MGPGFSGEKEHSAFLQLPVAPSSLVEKISWVLLMKMLPALVEKDIANFGRALTSIQCMVGDCFASVQGGRFATPVLEKLVEFLLEKGAAGAGQSSWGPTVYGLVDGKERARQLAAAGAELPGFVWAAGRYSAVQPQNRGARVRRIVYAASSLALTMISSASRTRSLRSNRRATDLLCTFIFRPPMPSAPKSSLPFTSFPSQ